MGFDKIIIGQVLMNRFFNNKCVNTKTKEIVQKRIRLASIVSKLGGETQSCK